MYCITYLETGRFFSPVFSGSDPANTNTVGGLPDRLCNGNLPAEQRTLQHWFDASCFATPPAGRFGNSGVNILEGPGYLMEHLSVAKTFNIFERLRFTFTVAAANLLNHPNFGMPEANISVPGSVGTINSLSAAAPTAPSRQIELRGLLEF